MISFAPVLAVLPAVAMALHIYHPRLTPVARARGAAPECILPVDFHVRDFSGTSNDTGATLSSYDFIYLSDNTRVSTACHRNGSSVSGTPDWLTPRFRCENRDVKFIWQGDKKSLVMIHRACPNAKGIPLYEVSGSVIVELSCPAKVGRCTAKQADTMANFTSISHSLDPSLARRRLG